MKFLGAMIVALGLLGVAYAADTATAPAASTKPADPACCGDKCKQMSGCCKADASGKITCGMGGSCCEKPATK